MLKTPLLYGVITGAIAAGWSFLLYLLGWDVSPFLRNFGYFTVVILAAGIYLGIQAKREGNKKKFITYTDAFRAGFLISLISGIILGAYAYLYISQINPGFVEIIIREKTEILTQLGISQEKIMSHQLWLERKYSPLGQFISNNGGFVLLGSILSAIFSIFLYEKELEE